MRAPLVIINCLPKYSTGPLQAKVRSEEIKTDVPLHAPIQEPVNYVTVSRNNVMV